MTKSHVLTGDDRRRLVPLALCAVIRHLIDDEGLDPSYKRIELRMLLQRVQRMYGIPQSVNESALAQELAEQDGVSQEDSL